MDTVMPISDDNRIRPEVTVTPVEEPRKVRVVLNLRKSARVVIKLTKDK